jgi:dolichol-phosphate mannosyltransferase
MRATVCLPTYNERENLETMIRALGGVLREDDKVLVIDDASPDGTGEIADRLAAELPWVGVLHRAKKEGLGPAYLAGFQRALADGADLVLGSRYVPGGSIPNWGLVRRAISLGGNLYAQAFLQSRLRDLTGGFKCFRRVVLETVDLGAIDSKGYAFQIETTYRVLNAGFRVVEVPISFSDRELGHSKMSRAIVLEAMWKVPALRIRRLSGRL